MPTIPSTMKCIQQDSFGDENTMYVGTSKTPQPSQNQVLIEVHGSALNRADILMRIGKYPGQKGPISLGLELSGRIAKLGSEVDSSIWNIGDCVMALVPGGGYAEYAVVNHQHIMKIPQGITLKEAGGIPEVWLTAYQLLHFVGNLKASDIVLIHGAGSGVGTAAIQLVKLAGATSIVTAGSQGKIDKAISLGAKCGFNYKVEEFDKLILNATKGRGVDLVLDCVGATYWQKNTNALARDGRWVLYGLLSGGEISGNILSAILRKRISITGTTLMSRSDDYKAKLISEFSKNALPYFEGKQTLSVVIDKCFPIEEVAEAHRYMKSAQNIGKILLQIREEI